MRVAKRFPFAARSWLVRLFALAVCASGCAAAQAPVATTAISSDLLLALLGSGTAIEIGLPDDVRVVHVVATRGDEVVAQRADILTDVGDDAASIVVSVGAVGPALPCPLLVFIHASLACGLNGVLPEHRRRGLATALKARTVEIGRGWGAKELRAGGGGGADAPIVPVNRAIGFGIETPWVTFVKVM